MAQLIPVYLTTAAVAPVRKFLAAATIEAWRHVPDTELHIIDAGATDHLWAMLALAGSAHVLPDGVIETKGSQRARHVLAQMWQEQDGAEIAIVTDDDILPPPHREWVDCALRGMSAPSPSGQPWGLVSAWLPEATLRSWPPPHARTPIAEEGGVGGLRFVRRGVPAEFPPYEPTKRSKGYDPALCQAVRDSGHAVGIFTHPMVSATHAGQHYSSVHPVALAEGQPVPA